MLLRKVLYAYDHPCARAPRCRLPQQLHHRLTVWSDGVVPGWSPQAAVRVDPHASAGGPYLCELCPLGHLMDRPLRPPRWARVHRHAPGLDGYFPGSNAAEQPHRGGEFYVAPGVLNFSREQGRTAAPLPRPSMTVVYGGIHISSYIVVNTHVALGG